MRKAAFFFLISALWTMSVSVQAAQTEAAASADQGISFVIMAPGGPIITRLKVEVARVSWQEWVSGFLARRLDLDQSGSLDAGELELLTPALRSLVGVSATSEILKSSMRPESASESTTITLKEFSEWFRLRLPESLFVTASPNDAENAVRLAYLIDLNGDSVVSAEELRKCFRTLRFRDLDDDETFSIAELLPYRDPSRQNAAVTPEAAFLPFFEVTDQTTAERAARQLIHRYGNGNTIPESVLRLPPEVATGTTSENKASSVPLHGGSLDQNQLTKFLLNPDYHATITFSLSDQANRSDVTAELTAAGSVFCQIRKDSFGPIVLTSDGMALELVARGGGANNRAYTKGFLGQNFSRSDGDKNQYLDRNEFGGIMSVLSRSGIETQFTAVDINNDSMVTRDELFRFAERDSISVSSRIEVSVEQNGQTLFGLLDTNQDRRLSLREIHDGSESLHKLDVSGDGKLADSEMGTSYRLNVGLGRAAIRRQTATGTMLNGMPANSTDALLPSKDQLAGPEWFRRMDRNQDRDVSRREFPGSSILFEKFDTDNDGLISVVEAEQQSDKEDSSQGTP